MKIYVSRASAGFVIHVINIRLQTVLVLVRLKKKLTVEINEGYGAENYLHTIAAKLIAVFRLF